MNILHPEIHFPLSDLSPADFNIFMTGISLTFFCPAVISGTGSRMEEFSWHNIYYRDE